MGAVWVTVGCEAIIVLGNCNTIILHHIVMDLKVVGSNCYSHIYVRCSTMIVGVGIRPRELIYVHLDLICR